MKKVIALLLALLVCINCMPVFAAAPQISAEPVLPDPESLTLFASADFSRDELSAFSISDFQLSEDERIFSSALKEGLEDLFENHGKESVITVPVEGWELLYNDMGASAPTSQEEADLLGKYFMQCIMELHPFDLNRVLFLLTADCPMEFFFMDKTGGMFAMPRIATNADHTGLCLTSWEFSFDVEAAYADSADPNRFTLNEAAHSTYQQAKANAEAIIRAHETEGDLEKLCSYRDEICSLVTYDHNAAAQGAVIGSGPWNIIHVFDKDPDTNVVCEGYAKAFQYLMQNSDFCALDIQSLYVTGLMSDEKGQQPHGWNNVIIGGKVYLVDVTNSDEDSIGENGGLFLAGAEADANGVYRVPVSGTVLCYGYDSDALAVYSRQQLAYEKDSMDLQIVCSHVNSDYSNDILFSEPTCKEQGVYIAICDLCGQRMEEYQAGKPLDPVYGSNISYSWSEDLSTCTAETLCSLCQGAAEGHRLTETIETFNDYDILGSQKTVYAVFNDSRLKYQTQIVPMTDDEFVEFGTSIFFENIIDFSGYFEPFGTYDIPEKKADFDEDTLYVSKKDGADIYPDYFYMNADEYEQCVSQAKILIDAILDHMPDDSEAFDLDCITREEALELKSLFFTLQELIRNDGTRTNDAGASAIVPLDELSVEFAGQLEYTGKAVVQPQETLILRFGEKVLQFKNDYTVSYKNNKTVGTAAMNITLKGEYKNMGENGGSVISLTFDIVPADLSGAVMSPIKDQTYNGGEVKPKAVFKLGKTTLKAGKDYEINYFENTGMGTAEVVITGKGNYTGTARGTFTINGAPISKAKVVLSPKTVMYSGEEQDPVVLTYGKTKEVLTEGKDYRIHYIGDHTNAGKALYWIEGMGDFEGTVLGSEAKPKNFKISPYDIKKNAAGEFNAQIIEGMPQITFGERKQVLTGSAAAKKDKTTDYAYSFKDKINKSTGEITRTWTIAGQKNLKGKVTITETIAAE